MNIPIVIFGQGIAGTLLSYLMQEDGIDHLVFDRGHDFSASAVAAGIVNPITGRWFSLVTGYDSYTQAFEMYRRLEFALDATWLYPLRIYRDLSQPESRSQWEQRILLDPAYAPFMELPISGAELSASIRWPSLVGPTNGGFRVDLKGLLSSFRQNLRQKGRLIEEKISLEACRFEKGCWHLPNGIQAAHIIDTRGAGSINEPLWSMIPWVGTKGEALHISMPEPILDAALKRKYFITPFGTGKDLWIGGTSINRDLNPTPGLAGEKALREQMVQFGFDESQQVEVRGAIRPTVKDYTPRAMQHPEYSSLWLLNALGTKGALWAPKLSMDLMQQIKAIL